MKQTRSLLSLLMSYVGSYWTKTHLPIYPHSNVDRAHLRRSVTPETNARQCLRCAPLEWGMDSVLCSELGWNAVRFGSEIYYDHWFSDNAAVFRCAGPLACSIDHLGPLFYWPWGLKNEWTVDVCRSVRSFKGAVSCKGSYSSPRFRW